MFGSVLLPSALLLPPVHSLFLLMQSTRRRHLQLRSSSTRPIPSTSAVERGLPAAAQGCRRHEVYRSHRTRYTCNTRPSLTAEAVIQRPVQHHRGDTTGPFFCFPPLPTVHAPSNAACPAAAQGYFDRPAPSNAVHPQQHKAAANRRGRPKPSNAVPLQAATVQHHRCETTGHLPVEEGIGRIDHNKEQIKAGHECGGQGHVGLEGLLLIVRAEHGVRSGYHRTARAEHRVDWIPALAIVIVCCSMASWIVT